MKEKVKVREEKELGRNWPTTFFCAVPLCAEWGVELCILTVSAVIAQHCRKDEQPISVGDDKLN